MTKTIMAQSVKPSLSRACSGLGAALLLLGLSGRIFADDQITEQLHNNTFQERAYTTCSYQGDCAVLFPVTTHVTTAITNIYCGFYAPSGVAVLDAYLGSSDLTADANVPTFYYGFNNGYAYYGISSAINLFIAQGKSAQLHIFAVNQVVVSIDCTISGYHS